MTQPQEHTFASFVEHKQKDAAGWVLLRKIIDEAKLTPEQEELIHFSLGLARSHRPTTRLDLFDLLGKDEQYVMVDYRQQSDRSSQ